MPRYAFWMVFFLLVVHACNQTGSYSDQENDFILTGDTSELGQAFDVIYALYLPTDIARLFEETGTGFNPGFLVPHERLPLYEDPGQLALLIGALGVDLSYCKLFERYSESAECYYQIELIAEKLDLPREIFDRSSENLEEYIDNPDSLTVLIDQIYRDVDNHFKSNNQESLASLSLLGGWLEAMYIGVNIYQQYSMIEMGDRILQQKYALTSLTGLLSNYQESLMVRKYMHPLKRLKEVYEQVDIKYSKDGFHMDHGERTLHGSISELNYKPETLEKICTHIRRIWEGVNQ